MLKRSDIDLLTQTGPGTPMGEVFRRFWLPALLPDELPGPDCAPIRLTMLSEKLVAFRDTSGKVGFVAENCPHRGASMFFGRNEERGLRCVYHGWKFDTSGACVDMPNEPPESNFKHKVRITAYPAAEWGGVIWIYMGPAELQPEVPELEWGFVPDSHRVIVRWAQECNYAQAMEGDLDTTHVSFLHKSLDGTTNATLRRKGVGGKLLINHGAPKLTARETDYGFCYGARRQADEGYYWRLTQLMLPGYSIIPSVTKQPSSGAWFPMDDHNSWGWRWSWSTEHPIPDEERASAGAPPTLIPGTIKTVANKHNDYQIDRELQRTKTFTGIWDFRAQDTMATESMGPIMNRTREHLGTADLAIIMYRRRMLRLANELQQGIEPYAATHGDSYRVRSLDTLDPAEHLDELLKNHDEEVFHSVR
jgi:phenylpropionate dioxygenase-like ring-hydroxylating dioxygenase large terminal subunit